MAGFWLNRTRSKSIKEAALSKTSDKLKLKYKLPSETTTRNFSRHVFDELDDENIKSKQDKISGFSDFLLAIALVLAKSEANE